MGEVLLDSLFDLNDRLLDSLFDLNDPVLEDRSGFLPLSFLKKSIVEDPEVCVEEVDVEHCDGASMKGIFSE